MLLKRPSQIIISGYLKSPTVRKVMSPMSVLLYDLMALNKEIADYEEQAEKSLGALLISS